MPGKQLEGEAAAEALARWLTATAGLEANVPPAADQGADLTVTFADGTTAVFEVKALAHPGAADVRRQLASRSTPEVSGRHVLVVADLLSDDAKAALRDAGVSYFDRRGEALLTAESSSTHVVGPSAPRPRGKARRAELGSGSGKMTAALAALLDPERAVPVRPLARASGLAPMTITEARRDLRAAALLDADYRAVTDALFDAVAAVWAPPRITLGRVPEPEHLARLVAGYARGGRGEVAVAADRLDELYHPAGDPARFEGPALAGDRAAINHGAGLVAPRDGPFDFYVPDDAALERVAAWAGQDAGGGAGSVAVAPTRLVCRLRRGGAGTAYPLVHPLISAIELAGDPARGREALASFDPPGTVRVW